MKVAFGAKAHSGWAALVVVGMGDGGPLVVDRRRIELVDEEWAKQPYHAAKGLTADAARGVVTRGVEMTHRIALDQLRTAVERERDRENDVAACAVLVGNGMPNWSTEEILAVHFRMHQAEGVLFRDALGRAVGACGLRQVAVPEKQLMRHAEIALETPAGDLVKRLAELGKSVGAPWGKDQKEAALAAMIALRASKLHA